jgi:hypothetical protein
VTNGTLYGTNTRLRPTFFYTLIAIAVLSAGGNILNVLTDLHNEPAYGLMEPIVWEASSWIMIVLFFWIPWIAFCLFPPFVRPRWRLLFHLPIAFAYSLCHVEGFILIRKMIYRLQGSHYDFGPFWTNFFYEFRKDAVAYALCIAGFTFVVHFARQHYPTQPPSQPPKFDIRDGTKIHRVLIADIQAVSSAGNYVEFFLSDGRKPSMRSSLSAIENELRPYGFLRTHRSWLVNPSRVTGLRPQGSGNYAVDIGTISVPLSRRFSATLAKLRGG